MVLLSVNNLSKAYGSRQAVCDVTFHVNKGEIFGLLGPNGAGKSTTMAIISGLLKPHAGSVIIGGYDMAKEPQKAKALIGFVPQEIALYPQLSAITNLKFWGTMNGLYGKTLLIAAEKVLDIVGLRDRAHERVAAFSGGMKRRLNIAAGIIHQPELLIMDEPTVGVDPQSRNHILETVKQLSQKGCAVIYTSHYVEEVQELCGRVAVMDNGSIISEGTVPDLLTKSGEYQELEITVNKAAEESIPHLAALPGIKQVLGLQQSFKILTSNAEAVLPLTFETIIGHNMQVSAITIHKPNLESLFLKLTGRSLRD